MPMPQCFNKQNAFIATFLVTSYFIGNLGPFGFSSVSSVSTVDAFCNSSSTNRAHCDSHHDLDDDNDEIVPLDQAFRKNSEGDFAMAALLSGMLSGVISFCFIGMCQVWQKHNRRDQAQSGLHYASRSSACARMFNRFRENVLPTRFEVGSLVGITLTFIAFGSAFMWLNSEIAYEEICFNQHPDDRKKSAGPLPEEDEFSQQPIIPNNTLCNRTFPTLNQADAGTMQALAQDVQANMLGVGISLIVFAGTLISVCAMSTIACVKARVSARESGLLAGSRANINDGDDVPMAGGDMGGYGTL